MSTTDPAAREAMTRERDTDLRRLARGSALNLAGSVVAAALSLVLSVVITRGLAREDAGVFFQVTALFTILINVGTIGADTGVLRSLPRAIALGRVADLSRYLRIGLVAPVIVSCALAIVGAAFARPISELATNDEGASADAFRLGLYIVLPMLPVAVGYAVGVSASRGLGSVRPLVVVEKLGRGGVQVAAVLAAVALTSSMVVIIIAWVLPYAAAAAVIAVWIAKTLRRLRQRLGSEGDRAPSSRADLAGDFWRFAAPRALSRVFSVALQRIDIIVVGALRGPADAAVYAAATRFLIFGLMFVQAIQQVMAPRISELLATGHHDRAEAMYRTTAAWLTLVSWPIYLMALWFAPLLLDVFGEGYDAGATAVVILCTAMLVATVCGPVDSMLLMGGRSVLSLANTGTALAVSVALDFLLIPKMGITGAAIGWSVGILVNNVVPLWQVARTMRMHPFGPGTVAAIGLCAATFGVLPGLCRLLGGGGLAALLTAGILASATFFLGLHRCREILELTVLQAVLRRRK